jgi:hypothetical protein
LPSTIRHWTNPWNSTLLWLTAFVPYQTA